MDAKILALICAGLIGVLEWFAIQKGMNGTALSIAVAAIAGLGGYGVGAFIKKISKS